MGAKIFKRYQQPGWALAEKESSITCWTHAERPSAPLATTWSPTTHFLSPFTPLRTHSTRLRVQFVPLRCAHHGLTSASACGGLLVFHLVLDRLCTYRSRVYLARHVSYFLKIIAHCTHVSVAARCGRYLQALAQLDGGVVLACSGGRGGRSFYLHRAGHASFPCLSAAAAVSML